MVRLADSELVRGLYGRAKIIVDWKGGRPLSVIALSDDRYGCAISATEMCELLYDTYTGRSCGQYYHKWTLDDNTVCSYLHDDIVRFCLFLPSLGPEGFLREETSYTAIDTLWNELDIHGRFVPPVATYNTI